MREFSIDTLPDLDESVMSALGFFSANPLPPFELPSLKRPLVVGSGNGLVTGRILFSGSDATFADESTYERDFARAPSVDGAVIISASGGKSSVAMAKFFTDKKLPTILITATKDSPASEYARTSFVFPKVREPYTYNVSTYLGMMLAAEGGSAEEIGTHITNEVVPLIPADLGRFDALFFVVPPELELVREMLLSKGDELFGAHLPVRAFTPEQVWHSKTLVPSETELFIHLGNVEHFGASEQQLAIPLPAGAGYAAMMATAYYVVGRIQGAHPPYFKQNLASYVKEASRYFGRDIPAIVE